MAKNARLRERRGRREVALGRIVIARRGTWNCKNSGRTCSTAAAFRISWPEEGCEAEEPRRRSSRVREQAAGGTINRRRRMAARGPQPGAREIALRARSAAPGHVQRQFASLCRADFVIQVVWASDGLWLGLSWVYGLLDYWVCRE